MATFQIKRDAPGVYSIEKDGVTGRIFRYEEGAWRGWWMVDWSDGSYSDPVTTYREAKECASNWHFAANNNT